MSLNSNVHTRTRVSHSAQITRTRASPLLSPLAWGFHPATAIAPTRRDPPPLRPRSRSKPNASHSKRAFRPPPPPSTPRIARAFLERATAPIDLRASRLEVLPRPIALASTSRDAHHPLARARAFASTTRVRITHPSRRARTSRKASERVAQRRRTRPRASTPRARARGPPLTRYFSPFMTRQNHARASTHARHSRTRTKTTAAATDRSTAAATDRSTAAATDRSTDG